MASTEPTDYANAIVELEKNMKQLREQVHTKVDRGSFDARFERLEIGFGQMAELLWHMNELIKGRFDRIEARLDAGGL